MHRGSKQRRGRFGAALAALVAISLAVTAGTAPAGAAPAGTMPERTGEASGIEAAVGAQLVALEGMLDELRTARDGIAAELPDIRVAQAGQDVAALNLRLSQIEEQVRVLTGQIEGLQFQLTQMQTLIERMNEDIDFRFQQLGSGGAGGNADAAAPAGGETPSGGLPQDPAAPEDFAAPDDFDDFDGVDVDMHGGMDPAELGGEIALGAPPQELGSLPADALRLPEGDFSNGPALDLDFDAGAELVGGDADTQYRAAYEAVVRGDFAFAEQQFRQFVSQFPEHPNAPDATNWLGESLLQRGAYDDAAEVLLTGFETYPNSNRAPDMLFKLGQALAGAGETETACRTYDEVLRRFPEVPPAFEARVAEERTGAQCG